MISIMLVVSGFLLGVACLAGFVESTMARRDREFEERLRPWITREGDQWGRD